MLSDWRYPYPPHHDHEGRELPPRRPFESWDAYAARVGGCPPVDLQPDEGVPHAMRDWLHRERVQREERARRAIGRMAEAFALCMVDVGGASAGMAIMRKGAP